MGSERNSSEIPWQMLHEILLKLPTKDVARSCCVSRLWRSVVSDQSFRNVHAMASHVISARTEALLVSKNRVAGRSDEACVFSLSSGTTMCCVPVLSDYWLAGVCNGFLCLVHDDGPEAPVVVCNPVTGETLALPIAPPLVTPEMKTCHMFALGFSPSTKEYKSFRLSYPSLPSRSKHNVEVDVYTLGDTSSRWRRQSYLSRDIPMKNSTPVFLHDKLYMLTNSSMDAYIHESILVIDVATESCCTHRLPDYETRQPMAGVFELNGQLWFVPHLSSPVAIRLWAMSLPGDKDLGRGNEPCWDLRYSFHGERVASARPWACWLDNDEMMSCMQHGALHMYDTRKHTSISSEVLLRWDKKLELPAAPSSSMC